MTEERLIRRADPEGLGSVAVCRLTEDGLLSVFWDYGIGWDFDEGGPWTDIDAAVDAYVAHPDTLSVERTDSRERHS